MRERRLLEEALRRAKAAGAARAEAFLAAGSGRSVEYTERGLETYRGFDARGLGLRVVRAGRAGFSHGQDFSAAGISRLAARAVEAAGLAGLPAFPFPAGRAGRGDLALLDAAGLAAPVRDDRERLEEVVRQARRAHPAVKSVKQATLRSRRVEVRILSTTGTDLAAERSSFSLAAGVVAERAGQSEMGWESDDAVVRDALAWGWVGGAAALKAGERLGAGPGLPGRQAVILDREVVAEFLSLLGSALSADAVLKGKSIFAGAIGKPVASPAVTIVDDPAKPGAVGSSPFDDEGQPTRRKPLFAAGVLAGYLHSLETAHRMGVAPTGNGFRRDFSALPQPRAGNLALERGAGTVAGWVGAHRRILLVDEILGAHTMNPVSGDFSVGASGFVCEPGSRRPFRGATIAGNLGALFRSVAEAGDDLRVFGALAAPSLLVRDLDVSC